MFKASAALLLLAAAGLGAPDRWEPNITAFEKGDLANQPAPGEVLFVGSSTIVGWNLTQFLPGVPAINRGFGGSEAADSLYFARRIILPYRPRVIVFYAGDNDIAGGKAPEQIRDDVATLLATIRLHLPTTLFVWVPIKPSVARWAQRPRQLQANAAVAEVLSRDPHSVVIDLDSIALGPDGQPRADLLKPDGLHFNEQGYVELSALVRPHLDYQLPATTPAP